MYGIIDIGSNTMRLSCYCVAERKLLTIFHKRSMVGLAAYVDEQKCLSKKGIQRAIETLGDFKNIAMCVGLDWLYVIATASFRNVENTKEIVERVQEATGLAVEVLSGKEEALCDFRGASYCTNVDSGMIVDIGGGSTELVSFREGRAGTASSMPVGSLQLFSKFVGELFPTRREEEEIRSHIGQKLGKLDMEKKELVLGVGGTNRTCLRLYNDYYHLPSQNMEMDCGKISEMLEKIRSGKKGGAARILKIVPDRVHTILPGMFVLDEINRRYQCKRVRVSDWGVREGYLIDKLL